MRKNMSAKSIALPVLFALILTGVVFAKVKIDLSDNEIVFKFDKWEQTSPIGCVYLGEEYLWKISPEEFLQGEVGVDVERFYRYLEGAEEFRISLFFEGVSGIDTVRNIESGLYSIREVQSVQQFEFVDVSDVGDYLEKFVFGRFAELRSIRDKIIERDLRWTADLTTVFMMPDRDRLLGTLFIPDSSSQAPQEPPRERPMDLPTSLDWRSKDGYNWVTSIKNQGSCGSCWAFSVATTAESEFLIGLNKPGLRGTMDLSEQHQVSCDHTCFPSPYSSSCNDGCGGGYVELSADFMRDTGNPDEACFPYVSGGSGYEPPCTDRCSDWSSRIKKTCSWQWINEGYVVDKTELKTGLQTAPLGVAMRVCSDFSSYSGGIYENTCWSLWSGGHAIALVGYNDSQSYWIMKNSWDTDWGESGFGRLHYDESDSGESCFGRDATLYSYELDAAFGISPTEALVGETISFTDATTHCLSLISHNWDFGDGIGSSTATNPTYSYSSPGTFIVTLIACDGNFCDTVSHSVIITPNEPSLSYHSHSIDDSAPGGDGDGYPEHGETIVMSINLEDDAASADAINVSGTLAESDAYVSIDDNSAEWPDIPAGANRESNIDHFKFTVANDNATCGHDVTFTINWDCESGTYTGSDNFVVTLGCPAPTLALESFSIVDSAPGGDDDGFPEPGESVIMSVRLAHSGGAGAEDVSAMLSESDAYITVSDDAAYWPDIAVGTSAESISDHFAFQIDPTTPDEHIVTFALIYTCYCGGGSMPISVEIGGPKPELVYAPPAVIDDAIGGDGDGYPEPGESVAMAITLENDGEENATGISGGITTSSSYATVTDANAAWPNIAIGASAQSSPDHFAFDIDPSTPCGETVDFTLVDTCNSDHVDTNTISVTIQSPPPTLSYFSHTIDDGFSGDSDGYPEAGESFYVAVTLQNSSANNANFVSATLTESDPNISIIDGSADWPDIGGSSSGSSISPHFALSASPDCPYLHDAELILNWQAFCASGADTFIVTIGDPTDVAPNIPQLTRPFPFERIGDGPSSVNPNLKWLSPSDPDGDYLNFQARASASQSMASPTTIDSRSSTVGFTPVPPVLSGSGEVAYLEGSQGEGDLVSGQTYWWDVNAFDGNRWSGYAASRSFTIDNLRAEPDWFQTTDGQFSTGTADNIEISGDRVAGTGGSVYYLDDDFESYSSQADFEAEWTTNGSYYSWQTANYHSSNHAIRINDNSTSARSYIGHGFTALSEGFMECWSMAENSSDEGEMIRFYSGSNRKGQLYYREGNVSYWKGSSPRYDLQAIDPGVWHHYRIDFDVSANQIYVTIDGGSAFGPYTFEGGASAIDYFYSGTVSYNYICDAYFDDYRVGQDGGPSSGSLASDPIVFDWNEGAASWGNVEWTQGSDDSIVVICDERVSGSWTPFDSTATSGTNGNLNISALADADTIRLRAKLEFKGANQAELFDWAVNWSEAIVGIEVYKGDDSGPEYSATSWAIGNIAEGAEIVMAVGDRAYVKNTGTVPVDIELKAETGSWVLSESAGADTVLLMCLFGQESEPPPILDFSSPTDELTEAFKPAGSSDSESFATASSNGIDISIAAGRFIYLYFKAPIENYQPTQQTMTITVKAVPSD